MSDNDWVMFIGFLLVVTGAVWLIVVAAHYFGWYGAIGISGLFMITLGAGMIDAA